MFSSSREWYHNEEGDFGHSSSHNMGSRDVDICRPDTDNSATCCGCVRKGDYPCEYQEIGGEPPPSIANCFRDPSNWDDSGTVCLSKDNEGCCPIPDFSDVPTSVNDKNIHEQQFTPQTIRAVGEDNLDSKMSFWTSENGNNPNKAVCYPSTEGGMCKYTTDQGTSLFYNYLDGSYKEVEVGEDGAPETKNTTTNDMRNEGKNVKKLLNYPMVTAESEGRNPPQYINLCDRNNWTRANTMFHSMTTQAGQDYYVDDFRERRRRQRVDSIGRMGPDGEMMRAEDLLGDGGVRDRFGSNLLSQFGSRSGSFFDNPQFQAQWDREEEELVQEEEELVQEEEELVQEEVTSVLYSFIVPDTSVGGDMVKVRIPSGTLVEFRIPDNANPGMRIKFRVNE
jgi:hypothetical protein